MSGWIKIIGTMGARLSVIYGKGEKSIPVARLNCQCWFCNTLGGMEYFFEALSFSCPFRWFSSISSTFREKPIPVPAMITYYDACRGDMEDGNSRTNDQVMSGELGKDWIALKWT